MSTNKTVSNRIIQPRPDHYREVGGIQYLLGPYTLSQRQKFISVQLNLLKTRYPHKSHGELMDLANRKWRDVVLTTIQDERFKTEGGDGTD